jgi:penicillin-insensitive murein endopeptidase
MHSAKNRVLTLVAAAFMVGNALAQSTTDQASLASVAATAAISAKIERKSAKAVFGAMKLPAAMPPRSIGTYAKGCMAGGVALPATGDAWQIMRPSRNRNWGNPNLVNLVERLARDAKAQDGWNGLLVGDIAQPRGGPMLSGHASHQIGLDADIWLKQMPDRVLTANERETMEPQLVTKSRTELNRDVWTEADAKLIKRAANYAEVARIFVHPPIKAELCRWATGDRSWLAKVRPYYGHNYHFHIRMRCPDGVAGCKNQWTPKPNDGTGCGDELAYWMGSKPWKRTRPDPNAKPPKPVPPLTIASLPAECRAVVAAP